MNQSANITLPRNVVQAAVHALFSIIACREGIATELLWDIAQRLDQALKSA